MSETPAKPTDRRAVSGARDRRVAKCPICHHPFTDHDADGCEIYACPCNIAAPSAPPAAPAPLIPSVRIEVFQSDFMPGWACFRYDGELQEGSKACVALNIGSLMAAVQEGDLQKADLPYMIAETLTHEVIHVLEAWAGQEFSEEKVEALLTKYREKYKRDTIWEHDPTANREAYTPTPAPPAAPKLNAREIAEKHIPRGWKIARKKYVDSCVAAIIEMQNTSAPPVASGPSEAIQQLEKIAKAIGQLEGLPVPYRLAKKLADVAQEIQAACEPGGSLND